MISKIDKIFLSVVIPAYNEEERIGYTLDSLYTYFSQKTWNYEIIVVNDGSTDRTSQVVLSHTWLNPYLNLVEYKKNQGKGYAVRKGMLLAQGENMLFMDADNSVSIDNFDRFHDYQKAGFDIVIASIEVAGAQVEKKSAWYRGLLRYFSRKLIRLLAVRDIKDSQRGFKLFNKEAARQIFKKQTIDRFGFDIELLAIAQKRGLKIKELAVRWSNPSGSKVNLNSYLSTFKELLKIRLNISQGQYD